MLTTTSWPSFKSPSSNSVTLPSEMPRRTLTGFSFLSTYSPDAAAALDWSAAERIARRSCWRRSRRAPPPRRAALARRTAARLLSRRPSAPCRARRRPPLGRPIRAASPCAAGSARAPRASCSPCALPCASDALRALIFGSKPPRPLHAGTLGIGAAAARLRGPERRRAWRCRSCRRARGLPPELSAAGGRACCPGGWRGAAPGSPRAAVAGSPRPRPRPRPPPRLRSPAAPPG